MHRKAFLKKALMASSGLLLADKAWSNKRAISTGHVRENDANLLQRDLKFCIFSKQLHWLNYTDMALVAKEMGYDGLDLTVRPGGHVLPERVKEDLPRAVDAVEKAGLKIYTMTTNIKSVNEKYTEDILKTASEQGVRYYRTGWIDYERPLNIPANLVKIKKEIQDIAAMNKLYNVHGDYQNHVGDTFGSSVWDLWYVLQDIDPAWFGSQYDIRHGKLEGIDTWALGLDLLRTHISTVAIKDFTWEGSGKNVVLKNVPLGQGIVDFKKYFDILKTINFKGPVIVHGEYALGGAEDGATKITISKAEFIKALKGDLITLKQMLRESRILSS